MVRMLISGAGGIRTHTGRILNPVPLPLGYGPEALTARETTSDAQVLAQPSDVTGGLDRVVGVLNLAVGTDDEG